MGRFRGRCDVTDEAESALATSERARLDLEWVRLSQDGAGYEQPGKGAYEAWQVTGKLVQGRVPNASSRISTVIFRVCVGLGLIQSLSWGRG